jgi:hypothetical protein
VAVIEIPQKQYSKTTLLEGFGAPRLPRIASIHAGCRGFAGPTNYAKTYNHRIPQRALKHLSPVQALKNWQTEKPNLFVKRVYNQTGLES